MLKNNSYAGKYIGGYHISLELASSSTSRIFLGESGSPDRHNVAIKRIYVVNITSGEDEESFLQEANVLKQLDHPYILPLKSAYVLRGTPYIVSEYAPNGTLQDRLQQRASKLIAQNDVITILSQVGQALYYAHQKNRIHGHLKPQNILFNEKGDALLADFMFTSLSSLADGSTVASSAGFAYMSPEQVEGINSKENDQYSLGCIAYEMFTGRKPFTTPSIKEPGSYYKTRTLIAPTKLNPLLSVHIEQAILKAMAKNPSQRYKNILEFIKALGTPGILIVPDDALLTANGNASQQKALSLPQFPGLKVANAGATTLGQFTAKAAHVRNPFTSLAGFSTFPLLNGRATPSLYRPGKHIKMLRPPLIIVSLLLITSLFIGVSFAFSSSHRQQRNQVSTGTEAIQHQGATPGRMKTMLTHSPTHKTGGGVIVPAQPTQRVTARSTTRPTLKPSPTHSPQPTTTLSKTTLSVAPGILSGNNCSRNDDSSLCKVTLLLGAEASSSQNWYTYSLGVGANFSPSSGTIAPGQVVTIQITVFDTCTRSGTFVFVGPKTNVTAIWSC